MLAAHLRALGHAAVERVMRSALCGRGGEQLGVGADQLVDELVAVLLRALKRRDRDAERLHELTDGDGGQR